MKAIVMYETGSPDVLRMTEVPTPTADLGQLLVRVEAIGVHFAETRSRAGAFLPDVPASLPVVPGIEAAGSVIETGADVDSGWVGRRVVVLHDGGTGTGTYAEYVTAKVSETVPIPDGLSSVDAVAVGEQGATALSLVRRSGLARDETVLIEAAAGAVGGYLVQLARDLGVRTIVATAGSERKQNHVRELGADIVLDHRDPGWPQRMRDALDGTGVDVVFESLGGASARQALAALTPSTGRMVFYGLLSGQPPEITPMDLLLHDVNLIGFGGQPGTVLTRIQGARTEILDRTAASRIHPLIDSVLPLSGAAEAHRRIENRVATGKLILTP